MNRRALPRIRRFIREQAGSTAAEFALVLAPLIMLTLGVINVGLMTYTVSALHFAAQDTARFSAIHGICANAAEIQARGATAYRGPGATATFTCSPTADPNCIGNSVTGQMDYNFTTGVTSTLIPISVRACYPAP